MTCFHPLNAYQNADGSVVFVESKNAARKLELSCGSCRGCRLARARSWAIRCMHEAKLHERSIFVTLTYSDNYYNPSLEYRDFQLFMKRLRKSFGTPIRFFCCGEYGAETFRPHFHALLFGCDFADRKKIGKTLFRSDSLDKIWPYGHAAFGNVTFQSAGYCSRYCIDKKTGEAAKDHYRRVNVQTGEIVDVTPEFAHMSLKPGIGYEWFRRYYRDAYAARDGVVVDGKVLPPPKYYDRLLESFDIGLRTDKEYDRYIRSERFKDDCTPERLAVREQVMIAGDKFYNSRSL